MAYKPNNATINWSACSREISEVDDVETSLTCTNPVEHSTAFWSNGEGAV
jgi:hypothetical protein